MMDVLRSLFGALDIVAIERIAPHHYQVIGNLPGWFVRLYPEIILEKDRLNFTGRFPFLENFLIDAEKFWNSEDESRLKSGVWIETDSFGTERQLEATALSVGDRHILLIEFPRLEFKEKQQLIQTGRENKLDSRHQKKARKALQKIENSYYAMLSAIPQQLFFFDRNGNCVQSVLDTTRGRPSRHEGLHIDEILGAGVGNHILALSAKSIETGSVETFRWEKQQSGKTKISQAYIAATGNDEFLLLIQE